VRFFFVSNRKGKTKAAFDDEKRQFRNNMFPEIKRKEFKDICAFKYTEFANSR
jgi:hypothetical protein